MLISWRALCFHSIRLWHSIDDKTSDKILYLLTFNWIKLMMNRKIAFVWIFSILFCVTAQDTDLFGEYLRVFCAAGGNTVTLFYVLFWHLPNCFQCETLHFSYSKLRSTSNRCTTWFCLTCAHNRTRLIFNCCIANVIILHFYLDFFGRSELTSGLWFFFSNFRGWRLSIAQWQLWRLQIVDDMWLVAPKARK